MADALDPVSQWARSVLDGKTVAGPHVRNACRRHFHDLEHASARGFVWDVAAAQRAIDFFPEVLCLNGGDFEGLPFNLHPAQKFIVGSLFGWKKEKTGLRRFRRAYIETAKGSGKSPLLGGIGLYCMLADGEARAEVYAAASKKDQAQILFRDAVAMVDLSPLLGRRLTKSGGNPVWQLSDPKTGSWFKPISSDDGQSGPRPSCALCDEVHEHRDRNTIDMLERGFKFRTQPLLVMATNSGTDRKTICWEEHEGAVQAAAGTPTPDDKFAFVGDYSGDFAKFSDTFFSFVCSLDKGDDPLKDPSCWVKANPLLGTTLTHEYMEGVVSQAKAIPGKANGILRLHFCVWTDADESWLSRETLESALADFLPKKHEGAKVYLGADLSATTDITALAFVVPTGTKTVWRDKVKLDLPTFDAWVEAWTPADSIAERAKRDRAPYEEWVKQGWLNAPSGQNIRLDFVAARVATANSEFSISALAYDAYSYRKLREELDALNVEIFQVEHPQGGKRRAKPPEEVVKKFQDRGEKPPDGLWMPGSLKELENMLLEGRIRLQRSPLLVSACMSAATESDPFDNRWFAKRKATNRIDAVVALAMAVGAATAGWDGKAGARSFWEADDAVERLLAE